jgi:hypothetical protein
MKEFKNLKELRLGSEYLSSELENLMENIAKEIDEENYKLIVNNLSFMKYLGGDLFIIESEEELQSISTIDCNLLEYAFPCDIGIILPNMEYAMLVIMTSDDGGATYFIPKEIYMENPNVLLSIILSNSEHNIKGMIEDD